MSEMSEFLSVPEAALAAGVSERTIWRRIRSGGLATERVGRHVRVRLSISAPVRGRHAAEAATPYGRDTKERPGALDVWPWTAENIRRAAARRRAGREAAVAQMEQLASRGGPDPDGWTVVDYLSDLRDPDWRGEA